MRQKIILTGVFFLLIFVFSSQAQQVKLTLPDVEGLVEEVCQLMMDPYVYSDIAEQICDTLRHNLEKGEYDVSTYKDLEELLSRDLKSVNQDFHLNVWSIPPKWDNQNTEKVDPITRQLHIIRENAVGSLDFKKIEILEGNIGYLELTKFKTIPDPRLERMLEGAMDFLSCCSAIILDQRINQNLKGVSSMTDNTLYAHGIKRVKFKDGHYTRWEQSPHPLNIGRIKGGNPFIAPDESYIIFNKSGRADLAMGNSSVIAPEMINGQSRLIC